MSYAPMGPPSIGFESMAQEHRFPTFNASPPNGFDPLKRGFMYMPYDPLYLREVLRNQRLVGTQKVGRKTVFFTRDGYMMETALPLHKIPWDTGLPE